MGHSIIYKQYALADDIQELINYYKENLTMFKYARISTRKNLSIEWEVKPW